MDTKALKVLAEAATPGPWDFDTAETPFRIAGGEVVGGDALPYGDVYTVQEYETPEGSECLNIATEIGVDNGRFIAAANPVAILALIESHEHLLKTAQELLRWSQNARFSIDAFDEKWSERNLDDTLNFARHAIAKATGAP